MNEQTNGGQMDEENSTPLHAAVDAGHAEVVEVLLNHGACPLASKENQPPSLHLACSQGKLRMVQSMVKHCGKQILTHPDQHKRTPLHSSSNSTPLSFSRLPTRGDTSLSSSSPTWSSRMSYTGGRRSWGPWANAQWGPFFTQ